MIKSTKGNRPTNQLIVKARKKRFKKKIIIISILLCTGTAIFITKSKVFIIKKVAILGNPIMSGEDVKERTEYLLGQNIFFIDKGDIIKEAKKNPYVKSVVINKVYPKQVNIQLAEKSGVYYIENDGQFYVLSDEAILLEKAENVDNRILVSISGIDAENIEPGEEISQDKRIISILNTFSEISRINPSNFNIDSIDLSDLMNIKVYIGEIEGRIGNDENIPDKMNKLIHIIENEEIGIKKGYVDVGFDGAPVYFKEE